MSEEQDTNASEPAPRTTNKKLDAKTLKLMLIVFGSLAVLVVFNMR